MSRLGRTEKTIFFIAIAVFMVMSYFLYDDTLLFPSATPDSLSLIGVISESQNDVRRKNSNNFSWFPASREDRIYENDSIFTGDRSEAVLHLNEGASLRLQPNSLVTLNLKSGQMILDLRYGNLKGDVKPGTSVTVRSGTEEFVVENKVGNPAESKVEFAKDHGGNVEVKLLSGAATFVNKKTRARATLSMTKPLTLKKNGAIQQAEKPELILTTADNLSVVRENPDDPMTFAWQSKGKINQYKFEISPKEDFSVVALGQNTTNQQIEIREGLEPGSYFWRVQGVDNQAQVLVTSPVHKITISIMSKPLAVVTPPAIASPAPAPAPAPTPALVPSATSAAEPPPVKVQPARPVLVTKAVAFQVPSAQERNLASPPSPQLKWKAIPQVKNYQLQISKDNRFTAVEKYDVTKNETEWAQYQPGKYHYRVIARGINGLTSEPSDVGTIDITVGELTLSPLKPITLIGKVPGPIEMPITWTEIPFAKTYLVQLDKDLAFSQPVQMEYSTEGGKLTIPEPGSYKVRVQALDQNAQPLTAFSNVEEAHYVFRSPLASPTMTEPFDNASIFLQTEMEPFIWLEWKAVEGSISYSIEISDKPNFSRILLRHTLTKTRYLVKDRIPLGKIYWRIRANGKTEVETSPWTERREFTLYHQKNETFVK